MTTHQREKRTLKPLLLLICFGHRTRSITHTGIRRLPLASSVQNALPVWAVDRIEVLIKKMKSSVFFMAQTGLRSSIILLKLILSRLSFCSLFLILLRPEKWRELFVCLPLSTDERRDYLRCCGLSRIK